MFNIREEGEEVKTGFNFYPLNSDHAGYVLKLGNHVWRSRYSKLTNKFHFNYEKIDE